jgi:cell surface protein SprA
MEAVNTRYGELKLVKDGKAVEAKLSQAFEEGLEAMPFMTRLIGSLMPRANWTFRWSGLEKLPLLNSFASRVTLDHSYSSSYRRRWRLTPSGEESTESQTVSFGFSPLVGLNFTFKDLIKGNLSATVRYGTNTNYDLAPASQNVVESGGSDISFTANYNRQGFEIPFFGLALSNDLDANVTYTFKKNARRVYDFRSAFKPEGQPMEGSSNTILEPRIRYVLSARVTASLYYRYTKISPDAGGSRIPGSTINEGGLDIHVAIQ